MELTIVDRRTAHSDRFERSARKCEKYVIQGTSDLMPLENVCVGNLTFTCLITSPWCALYACIDDDGGHTATEIDAYVTKERKHIIQREYWKFRPVIYIPRGKSGKVQ
ncbi:hypothetical protein ACI65C_011374 [Semiaphis heraclei]